MDGGARENAAAKKVFDVPWSEPVLFWQVGVEIAEQVVLGLVCKLDVGGFDEEGDLDPKVR
jgi:hypothetical protein